MTTPKKSDDIRPMRVLILLSAIMAIAVFVVLGDDAPAMLSQSLDMLADAIR